jgi:hypothetical protein
MRFADDAVFWTQPQHRLLSTALSLIPSNGDLVSYVLLVMQAHASEESEYEVGNRITIDLSSHQSATTVMRIAERLRAAADTGPQVTKFRVTRARGANCNTYRSLRKLYLLARMYKDQSISRIWGILRTVYGFVNRFAKLSDQQLMDSVGRFVDQAQRGILPPLVHRTAQFVDTAAEWEDAAGILDGMCHKVRFTSLRTLLRGSMTSPEQLDSTFKYLIQVVSLIPSVGHTLDEIHAVIREGLQEFVTHIDDVPGTFIPSYWLMRLADEAIVWKGNGL